MVASRSADVIVVGAGPVGLLAASELALHGVQVTVIERNAVIVDQPKAGTIHARPAQLLRRRGYLPSGPLDGPDGAVAQSPFHFAAQAAFTVSSPLAEGAPVVGLWQAELEALLESVCRARGVEILRAHEATSVDQDRGSAWVDVDGPGGARRLRAGWVVGADGGRGLVRRAAGIEVDDLPPTLRGLMSRVRIGAAAGHALAGWRETPRGWTLVNLHPGGPSRLITFEFGDEHVDRAAPVTLDELRATAERITGRDVPLDDLEFSGRFSDFSRLARTYRAGRLLLAGDAAHVHYPVGGQGLNLGLQDAFNLAWKLAMVVRHGARDGLLDTYTAERRPYAERAITYTRDQARAMDPRPEHRPHRGGLLGQIATAADRARIAAIVSSQDVRTASPAGSHALVGAFLPDRAVETSHGTTRLSALLSAGRPLVLHRADAAGARGSATTDAPPLASILARWADRIDVVLELTELDDAAQPAVSVVRPDGHVAWAGDADETDDLAAALERWLGPPRDAFVEPAGHGSVPGRRPFAPRPMIPVPLLGR